MVIGSIPILSNLCSLKGKMLYCECNDIGSIPVRDKLILFSGCSLKVKCYIVAIKMRVQVPSTTKKYL